MALLLRLQEIRPVELWAMSETAAENNKEHDHTDEWSYQLIKLDSQPLQVNVASFILSNVGWARSLTYAYSRQKDGFCSEGPHGYNLPNYDSIRRERIPMIAENDLVVGFVHLRDMLVKEPLKWLEQQIEKYSKGGGE